MYGNVEDTRTIKLDPGDPIRSQLIDVITGGSTPWM